MSFARRFLFVGLAVVLVCSTSGRSEDKKPYSGPACTRNVDDYFTKEVWAKVGSVLCVNCHKVGGDAEESKLILKDTRKVQGHAQEEAIRHNRDAFARLASIKEGGQARLLVKATGGLDHGGADVLKAGSKSYLILAEFVRRLNTPVSATPRPVVAEKDLPPFFDGVALLEPKPLVRRLALSLAGRLPTPAEQAAVVEKGLQAVPPFLDALMKEDAFYERLREGFNDVFLTIGLDGNPEATVLAYEHFTKTRLWTQKHDLSHIPEKDAPESSL